MLRSDIINQFIKKYSYNSYLEVGYGDGETFHKVELPLENKTGIDNHVSVFLIGEGTVKITSDNYFRLNEQLLGNKKYDIIFIDGSHLCEDVENDLKHSLGCLKEGGTIVMHDCNPPNKYYQERIHNPTKAPGWTGDTWKTFVKFRATREDLEMYVVDTDFGCGVVRVGQQEILDLDLEDDLYYDNFEENKNEWLNLITIDDFKRLTS